MKFDEYLKENVIFAVDKFQSKTATNIRNNMKSATAALRGQEAVEIASDIETQYGKILKSPTIMSYFSSVSNPISSVITIATDKSVPEKVRNFGIELLKRNKNIVEKDINSLIKTFSEMEKSSSNSPSQYIYRRYINKWKSLQIEFKEIVK